MRGSRPVTSHAAATPAALPAADSSQLPMFIGELGLTTRSMFRNRPGRPRSLIRSAGLAVSAPAAISVADRASGPFRDARAPSASSEEPPARPPLNRYQPISVLQIGGLMIGRP